MQMLNDVITLCWIIYKERDWLTFSLGCALPLPQVRWDSLELTHNK